MKNALVIKTFGRGSVQGEPKEIVINESNVVSVEEYHISNKTYAKIWLADGSFFIDLSHTFNDWVDDSYLVKSQ